MGFESNSISIPFHWSGGILAITIVVSIILVGTGFYIASLNWPTVMLWLKYLLIIVFFIAIIVGVGYMPIRLKADNGKIMVKNLFAVLIVCAFFSIKNSKVIRWKMIIFACFVKKSIKL